MNIMQRVKQRMFELLGVKNRFHVILYNPSDTQKGRRETARFLVVADTAEEAEKIARSCLRTDWCKTAFTFSDEDPFAAQHARACYGPKYTYVWLGKNDEVVVEHREG